MSIFTFVVHSPSPNPLCWPPRGAYLLPMSFRYNLFAQCVLHAQSIRFKSCSATLERHLSGFVLSESSHALVDVLAAIESTAEVRIDVAEQPLRIEWLLNWYCGKWGITETEKTTRRLVGRKDADDCSFLVAIAVACLG